jgi:signal peptidase I
MAPSFRDGQVFLASRVRDSASLETGDVVLAQVHGSVLLKRVYALGGDTVWAVPSERGSMERVVPRSEVRRLRLMLSRQYPQQDLVRYEVPPDCVFVLGDARSDSYDSRHFGAVPSEAIRARVVVSHLFRLWEPSRPGSGVAMASSR